MARLSSTGKPQSVELQNLFGSPEELRASRAGPSEQRIERQLHFTQEQIPFSEEIMEYFTAMLKDHEFSVQACRRAVGTPLSGTERLIFSLRARANFFNHPNVGVARMDPIDQLVKAGAIERELVYVVTRSAAM